MRFHGINHVSLRAADLERARGFYVRVLGFTSHPKKNNWLGLGQGCSHPSDATDHRHRRRSGSCESCCARGDTAGGRDCLLLAHGCAPFQSDVTQRAWRITFALDLRQHGMPVADHAEIAKPPPSGIGVELETGGFGHFGHFGSSLQPTINNLVAERWAEAARLVRPNAADE
jgi:catechol 2,3-dioxygenase-like lactoylglutathione lyase family enzyme